jgi:hypothetical protein
MIWQLFPFFHAPQAELFIAAARAIADKHHLAAMMFFSATFGNVILVMVVLALHLVKTAATVMIGSPFGGTLTDVAIADALPGNGVNHSWQFQCQRRKWTHGNQHID